MKSFTFQSPSNILFEVGAAGKIAERVKDYRAKHVLLVTDKGVRAAGLTSGAEAALAGAGIALTVFEDVQADPPSHIIESAAELCRSQNIDLVLSIGGGSALDTAKLVAYLARTPDKLDDIYGVGLARGERLPLLLVPTTAGTGSEVTPIAINVAPHVFESLHEAADHVREKLKSPGLETEALQTSIEPSPGFVRRSCPHPTAENP